MSPRDAFLILRDAWRARRLAVGPLVITTRTQMVLNGREWYEVGREVGAARGPGPRPAPVRHLHVVS